MDEGTAADVDERAVIMRALPTRNNLTRRRRQSSRVVGSAAGIIVHLDTSVYINRNEVEPRLGTNIEVYARSIALTYS
jgi:hypothetical protein